MVQFIQQQRNPGFAERLGRGISNAALDIGPQLSKSIEASRAKQAALSQKNLANLSPFISKELKSRGRKSLADDPDYLESLRNEMLPLVEAGMDPSQAFNALYSKKEEEFAQQARSDEPYHVGNANWSDLGKGIERFGKSLPYAGSSLAEAFVSPLLNLAQQKSSGEFPKIGGSKKREKYFRTPSEMFEEKLRNQETPEEAEKILQTGDVLSATGGVVAPGLLSKAGKFIKDLIPKKAISPSEIIAAPKNVPKQIGNNLLPEGQQAPKTSSLQGRVSREVTENPTDMRISRASPETRIYPRLQNIEIAEQQMKLFPKYEAEIAEDAAARAARAQAREPKTEVGKASQQARIEKAESALPVVRKSYENSIARVRALENEVVHVKGAQKEHAQTLLELAQKDLENAEFELIQTLSNAKTGQSKVGIEAMEKAAQTKIEKIKDMVASGEEVKLAKMDYSPAMIAEAKKIAKGRQLPSRKVNDFYTIVHDQYAGQYKNRLSEIEKEIKHLMQDKSLRSLSQRQVLGKERDALNKLIESAEAENVIHRHKIALREIDQTKMARDRFKQLRKQEGQTKSSRVAEQKMWKERIQEAKTPQERAKVIDQATDKMAAENPKVAEKIKAEGEKLTETFEKIKAEEDSLKNASGVKDAPNAKEAGKRAKTNFQKFIDDFKEMKDNFPNLWSTKMGQDIIIGSGSAIIESLSKDLDVDLPFGGSTAASFLFGRSQSRGTRVIINALTRWGIKQWKINNATKLYRQHKDKEFNEYSSSIKAKARKRAFQ